jgi:hypothetical protein
VQHAKFVKPNDPDIILPTQRYKNFASVNSGPGDRFNDRFGLQEYHFERDPFPLDEFRNYPGTQPQISLRCFRPDGSAGLAGPTCDGYIYYEDKNLYFYIRFHSPQLRYWNEILQSSRDLILSWRQD